MLNETKQHFFKRLIEDTIGYYRVYDFLKMKVLTTTEKSREFLTTESFWRAILQEDFRAKNKNSEPLKNGQTIKLKNFFLTEWTPKLPGRIWTNDGKTNLIQGINDVVGQMNIHQKVYDVLGPIGKNKMMTGGYGTIRIKAKTNNEFCMLLNVVSPEDWHCDYGIPLIVSKAVYDQYLNYSHNEGAPWIEELQGTLFLNNSLAEFQLISPAIGARLENEINDLLTDMPNLQKCFIYVSSPLDVKIRYNQSHPEATAWTMFKTNITEEPLRLTYAKFNPIDNESTNEATEFINQYVLGFDGTEILTDFDAQKRRLISKSNLSDIKSLASGQRTTLFTIYDWMKKENRKNSH
ncbi:hypothetical protein [Flavobacterium psychrophilum]|uniref:hypothetical protein n=1 Tax=Flavobacterium psychrophilum TaxID=96345 RepID=UPI00106979D0|nr:hypothetical protein [Flavobacterium psychrophilum]